MFRSSILLGTLGAIVSGKLLADKGVHALDRFIQAGQQAVEAGNEF